MGFGHVSGRGNVPHSEAVADLLQEEPGVEENELTVLVTSLSGLCIAAVLVIPEAALPHGTVLLWCDDGCNSHGPAISIDVLGKLGEKALLGVRTRVIFEVGEVLHIVFISAPPMGLTNPSLQTHCRQRRK